MFVDALVASDIFVQCVFKFLYFFLNLLVFKEFREIDKSEIVHNYKA